MSHTGARTRLTEQLRSNLKQFSMGRNTVPSCSRARSSPGTFNPTSTGMAPTHVPWEALLGGLHRELPHLQTPLQDPRPSRTRGPAVCLHRRVPSALRSPVHHLMAQEQVTSLFPQLRVLVRLLKLLLF